jgi:hypothetical protein
MNDDMKQFVKVLSTVGVAAILIIAALIWALAPASASGRVLLTATDETATVNLFDSACTYPHVVAEAPPALQDRVKHGAMLDAKTREVTIICYVDWKEQDVVILIAENGFAMPFPRENFKVLRSI